jgi:hypothetical protein
MNLYTQAQKTQVVNCKEKEVRECRSGTFQDTRANLRSLDIPQSGQGTDSTTACVSISIHSFGVEKCTTSELDCCVKTRNIN